MLLNHHVHMQLMRERQRDLLREGDERRALAAAACGVEPEPLPSEPRERPRSRAKPATDGRSA
jgi:hypothetical protein